MESSLCMNGANERTAWEYAVCSGQDNHDDEPPEEDPGGYACVCTNKLTPLNLKVQPTDLPGKVRLSATGGQRIRVWENAGRTGEVVLTNGCAQVAPGTLYVEGVTNSAALRDVELRLEYDENPPGQSNPLFKCEDRVRLVVIKVDLDIWNGGADLDNGEAAGPQGAQVPDADEESVGAYILVNWDDDDGDGKINGTGSGWISFPVPDLDESTAITDEDNLAQLKLNLTPLLDLGTVELEVSGTDAGKIKLWTESTKGTVVTLTSNKKTWNLSNPTQKSEFQNLMANSLWIEGVDAGSGERAATFTLCFKDSGGTEICNDVNKATLVMLNLANVAGREVDNDALAERGHTAVVGRYDGSCTKADLLNAAHYTLYEADGGGDWAGTEPGPREALLTHVTARPGREFFGSLSPFLTSYYNSSSMPNTAQGYRTRLKILLVARRLIDNTASIGYTKFNAVLPGNWNGNLGTITDLRCDGFVEVCYEWSGVNSWGRIAGGGARYSILVAGNQDDHNEWVWGDVPQDGASDFWAWLMPITQIGYADTYIDSHYPPYTNGDFDYTANNFEGTFWESAFSSQQLVMPTLSNP